MMLLIRTKKFDDGIGVKVRIVTDLIRGHHVEKEVFISNEFLQAAILEDGWTSTDMTEVLEAAIKHAKTK